MSSSQSNASQQARRGSFEANDSEFTEAIVCATVFEKTSTKQVDTRRLSSSGAALLKAQDPFMYYSVPTLRRASYLKMDLPTFQAAASAGPFDLETDHSSDESLTVVRRQSRVSTECHPDYLFTEFYGLNDNEDDTDIEDEDSDAEEDFLMAIIEAKASLASSTSS
ncbi:hypothetical protein ACHAXN_005784 [Cyclotella atomus]